jgi:predicted transglutaminase-like cysteine proteinase
MRKAFAGFLVLFFSGCVAIAGPRTDQPFGMVALKAPEGPLWNAWRRIRGEIRAQLPRQEQCLADLDRCNAVERLMRNVVKEAEAKRGRAKIETANVRINAAIRYTSDEKQWNVADAWSAPLMGNHDGALETGLGDCEDYSIAKYVVLRLAGIAPANLRVVLLHDNAVSLDHAVLAARDGTPWFILDNRWNTLFEARDLEERFKPLYAIDADGVTVLAKPFRLNDQKANRRVNAKGRSPSRAQ